MSLAPPFDTILLAFGRCFPIIRQACYPNETNIKTQSMTQGSRTTCICSK
jgi:hypothetical protein